MRRCARYLSSCLFLLSACGTPSESKLSGLPRYELPSREVTPGEFCSRENPDFDEYRYREKVAHCRRNVSREDKIRIGRRYGLTSDQFRGYEFDHLIPLSFGGSNSDKNVWPLLVKYARQKSVIEQQLFEKLKDSRITRAQAVAAILDWRPEKESN